MIDLKGRPFYLADDQVNWVQRTFEQMDINEKIGQLFCPIGMSTEKEYLKSFVEEKKVGGILFRPGNGMEVQGVHRYLQEHSAIPLLIASNLEAGGTGAAVDGTRVGNPMLIAAGGESKAAYHLGEVCAREGEAVGVNWAFAPVVDIDFNPHNPITNVRTYGSDPQTVLEYAAQYVRGVQENGLAASIKHFPGDGVDFRDQHLVTSVNSMQPEEWDDTYGKVYSGLIKEGVLSVMAGHIALPYYHRALHGEEKDQYLPATLSPVILQSLLREKLGFNGLICSDATPMVGFASAMERRLAVPTAIEAGCDIFLFNKDLDEDIRYMQEGLENGLLSHRRLDEAVLRILALKAALHLPEKQQNGNLVPSQESLTKLQTKEHVSWARQTAGKGITLVKETAKSLPLSAEKTPNLLLEVLGPYEESNRQIIDYMTPLLEKEGFQVTLYQPENFSTGFDTVESFRSKYDVVLYLANVENRSNATTTRLNWHTFFGQGNNIPWFVHEVPVIFISLANPYHLMDVPMVPVYINAYDNHSYVLDALVEKLMGRCSFTGNNPVDPYCSMLDAKG